MFATDVLDLLHAHDVTGVRDDLEVPPDPKLGDYALPCFSLASEQGRDPATIASELASRIEPTEAFIEIEAAGPYVNFFIDPIYRAEHVIKNGSEIPAEGDDRILIEYPSPNTNKPLHLGHVRNMVIGSSVSTILDALGHDVIDANLYNDRGVHICKSMLAYQRWGDDAEPDKKPDHFVGDYYVLYATKREDDPSLDDDVQAMLQAWEDDDEEVRALWRKMNDWAYEGFHETFEKYKVSFDTEYYESEIYQDGKRVVLDHKELWENDDGALVATFDDLPDKVVLRSDGTSIYSTQDIGLTMQKIADHDPDRQIWVVANEQNLYFKQLFAILDKLGVDTNRFHHLSYGMVSLPDGSMKSREGNVVDADDLLAGMEDLAATEIRQRRDDWSQERIDEVKRDVALAAIRFFILKYDPRKNFTFNPEESLSFEGDTGPYLQYTHARICSILDKAPEHGSVSYEVLSEEEEQGLLRELSKFSTAVDEAGLHYKPSTLATQLLEIAHAFNTFYHACPVLQADDRIRDARLALVDATRQTLANGLELLCITPLEEM